MPCLRITFTVVVVALFAAACGGGGGGDETPAPTSSTTTVATTTTGAPTATSTTTEAPETPTTTEVPEAPTTTSTAVPTTTVPKDEYVPTDYATEGVLDVSELAEDVTPVGVIAAAVLLATGDIEAALADGLVTPAEVEVAADAIDNGTLDDWMEQAG
ncbi:MAG: hypothetical protein H8E59_07535 [Actinobacteria bacterium]|nr:hypothetical protein [Actinomycetota bacterium]